MAKIGLVVRTAVEAAVDLGRELLAWARKEGHQMVLEVATAEAYGVPGGISAEELAGEADPIVSLGGDGTLIGVGRYVSSPAPLLVGVNFGHLGFLTEISPEDLFPVLKDVLSGRSITDERSLLKIEACRGGKPLIATQAVNDVVVQKGVREKLIDFSVNFNGQDVASIRGDGLIIATPTGSTAYSLSAGGSIVYPTLETMLVTPICPHSLTNRPFILPLSGTLLVTVPRFDGKVFLIIDGQVSVRLEEGDCFKITQSENKVRFVKSASDSYFDILRNKLNWHRANQDR